MKNASCTSLLLVSSLLVCQCVNSPKTQSNNVSPTDSMFHVDIFEPIRQEIVNLTQHGTKADWEKHSTGSHPVRNTSELEAVHDRLSTEQTPAQKMQAFAQLEKMLRSSNSAAVYSFEMDTVILVFFKKNEKVLGYYPSLD